MKQPTPKQVRDLRVAHKLTQQQAADLLHITLRHYCRYEAGDLDMPLNLWELFNYKVKL